MSRAKDPRIVDIMRIVEKLTDSRYPDPSGIGAILEKLSDTIDPLLPSEAKAIRSMMRALCERAAPRLLGAMHLEALKQECINAELCAQDEKAGAA